MADSHPRPGDFGGWGVRGDFHSDADPTGDPRYADHEYDPAAYVRVYISDSAGWKTIYGGFPLDEEEGAIDDIIESYATKYGVTSGE